MRKSLFTLTIVVFWKLSLFAFDHEVNLYNKTFTGRKFRFGITKVIDGRLNRKKPIGAIVKSLNVQSDDVLYSPFVKSLSPNESVGNDSLGERMDAYFKLHNELFDNSTNTILVLKQCNLRNIHGYSLSEGGEIQDLEFTVAFDYYNLNENNKYVLSYQQYFTFPVSIKYATSYNKVIDIAFSQTIILAFFDFNRQIKTKPPIQGEEFTADSLFQYLSNKSSQVVTNKNIKDGFYFSAQDLYFNNPLIVQGFSYDTNAIGLKPIIVTNENFVLQKPYAIVLHKQIYLYIDDNYYKMAALANDGILFFPDLTTENLPKNSKENAIFVGDGNVIVPLGYLGVKPPKSLKYSNESPQTDVIIDFESGCLEYKWEALKMRIFLLLIFFNFAFLTLSQCVEIEINTRQIFLKKKHLILNENSDDFNHFDIRIKPDKIVFGKITIHDCFEDTLLFKIKGKMPILIVGLKQLDTSIIKITQIPLTHYISTDTSFLQTTKYKKNGNVDTNSVKIETNNDYNSKKFRYNEQEISINGKLYKSKLVSLPHESNSYFCIPDKIAYHQYFEGVEKIYLFEIQAK